MIKRTSFTLAAVATLALGAVAAAPVAAGLDVSPALVTKMKTVFGFKK